MFLKITAGVVLLLAVWCFFLMPHRSSTPGFPTGRIDGLVFESQSHGYVQALKSPRLIYETNNGGQTWKEHGGGTGGFRTGRSFANAHKGWSIDEDIRDHAKIFQTNDGGTSWKAVFNSGKTNNFVFGGIQALSEDEVWAVGTLAAYHSADGGVTWMTEGPAGTALQFLDRERGWISGDKFWQTTDGGKSWNAIDKDGETCFGGLGFYFLDDKRGWAVSGETEGNMEDGARTGHVLATRDGGKTCEEIARIPGQFLWSVFFLDAEDGWVGGIGSLLKTTDGGSTWVRISGE